MSALRFPFQVAALCVWTAAAHAADAAGTPFADSAFDGETVASLQISGRVAIDGVVTVTGLAGASLAAGQSLNGPAGAMPGDRNGVDIGADTGRGASGNLGLNVVGGDFNQQQNAIAYGEIEGAADALAGSAASADASFFQKAQDLDLGAAAGTVNHVALGAGALRDASANIGLNAAGGAFNMQANLLAIAAVDAGSLAQATAALSQRMDGVTLTQQATLNSVTTGDLLQGASGNIGVNIAAGFGNQQLNSVTIADARGQ